MKIKRSIILITVILILRISSSAQTAELSKLIKETQVIAEKTTAEAYFEFSYDFKTTVAKKGEKPRSKTFESVCSKKRCVYILVENDGNRLSEKAITASREKAAARLAKAENRPDADFALTRNFIPPYDFLLSIDGIRKNPYFNSNFYLKNCQVNFVEKSLVENRAVAKFTARNCDFHLRDSEISKFVPTKTEALIWIDELGKAVYKIEIYAENELTDLSSSIKPTVILETARVPEGYRFWKFIKINSANEKFFRKNSVDWKIEFYNYNQFTTKVEKAEIDKK